MKARRTTGKNDYNDNESKKNNRTKGLYYGPAMRLRRVWFVLGG
jgi:hypothetical protein